MLLRFCRSHLWNTSDHLSFMLTAPAPLHRPFTPQVVFLKPRSAWSPHRPVFFMGSSPPSDRVQAPSRAVCPSLSAVCSPLPLPLSPPLPDTPHLPNHVRRPRAWTGCTLPLPCLSVSQPPSLKCLPSHPHCRNPSLLALLHFTFSPSPIFESGWIPSF